MTNSSDHRPVVLSRSDRDRLVATAAGLERRKFMRDAEILRGIVERWDGSRGFVVVHEAAMAVRPDPQGEPG
jgi:hypothetical protein